METQNNYTIIEILNNHNVNQSRTRKMARVRCECGSESIKDYHYVISRKTKSCSNCVKGKPNLSSIKHNLIKHKLYRKWQDMLNRCRNKNVDRYMSYGGRGIKVCEEWATDFKNYYDWCMANGWEDKLQVDRIDVDGNYEPSNCRIVKAVEQGFNKRNTLYVEYEGKKFSLAKLCFEQNLPYKAIWLGLKEGRNFSYYVKKHNINLNNYL
jgi:hypothetical protein